MPCHPYTPLNASDVQLPDSVKKDISKSTEEYKVDSWIQISKLRVKIGSVPVEETSFSCNIDNKVVNTGYGNGLSKVNVETSNRFETLKIYDENDSWSEFEDDDCQSNNELYKNLSTKKALRRSDIKVEAMKRVEDDRIMFNKRMSSLEAEDLNLKTNQGTIKYDQKKNIPALSENIKFKTVKDSDKQKLNPRKKDIKKSRRLCLKIFETKNCFDVLEDNQEEDYQKILKRRSLLHISKKRLKKCKKCNFKRRSCLVDSTECKAHYRSCFKCKKQGHFPRSPQCKAGHKLKKKVSNVSKTFVLNKNTLFLVKKRIMELECLEDSARRSNEARTERKDLPVNVTSDEMNLKQKILNAGYYCARKFSSGKGKNEKLYFIRYCNRKLNQVTLNQSVPSLQSCESIKKTLEIFDKIFSKNDHDLA